MKKHYSDEQFMSILREAEAGISAREFCRKHAISDDGVKSLAVWTCRKLSL